MGSEKEDLSELTSTKKELVDFIGKNEKSLHDIIKKLGVTDRYVRRMIFELNDAGILAHHEVGDMTMHFIKPGSIKISHETDQFFPYLYVMAIGTILSIMFSMFIIYSYKFLIGAVSMMGIMLMFFIYKIFKTPDIKHYLYKKPSMLKHNKSKAIDKAIDIIKNNRRRPRAKTIKKIVEKGLCSQQTAYRLYNKHHKFPDKTEKPIY